MSSHQALMQCYECQAAYKHMQYKIQEQKCVSTCTPFKNILIYKQHRIVYAARHTKTVTKWSFRCFINIPWNKSWF